MVLGSAFLLLARKRRAIGRQKTTCHWMGSQTPWPCSEPPSSPFPTMGLGWDISETSMSG